MGAQLGHVRARQEVALGHQQVAGGVDGLQVGALVGPVGADDVLNLLGHFDGAHKIRRGHAHELAEKGIVAPQHLGVRSAAGRPQVGQTALQLSCPFKVEFQGLGAAGTLALHIGHEGLLAVGNGGVQRDVVALSDDGAESVGDGQPVHLNAQLVKEPAQLAALCALAEIRDLVQGGLKLEAAPHKASGGAADHIVLFDDQRFQAHHGRAAGRHGSAVAAAHDHQIVLISHGSFLLSF